MEKSWKPFRGPLGQTNFPAHSWELVQSFPRTRCLTGKEHFQCEGMTTRETYEKFCFSGANFYFIVIAYGPKEAK